MHDPTKWKDPFVFNPDRFLEEPNNPSYIPFLVGKRICLGKALGETQLLIFLVTMVKSFKFLVPDGETLPSYHLFPKEGSVTSRSIVRYAPAYKVKLVPRE